MERFLIDLPVQRVLFCCQAVVLLGALALASRPRWLTRFLLACALLSTAYVSVRIFGYEAPPSNYSHYYLGAKYRVHYPDFYRLVLAGRGEPLLNVRDLTDYRLFNNDPQEAGAYFRRLLDEHGVAYPSEADWRGLMALCRRHDLFRADGRAYLDREGFSEERRRELAADLAVADVNVRDCGFNGSPFYVLARQLDPALHLPLSVWSYRLSALLEVVLLALSCFLLARAFRLGAAGALLGYGVILVSWDFYDWVLSGLPGMLWFLPLAGSLFCLSRERYVAAGVLCAVAGLLKIFPGLLVLPALVALAVRAARREPGLPRSGEVLFLGATAAAGLGLAAVAQARMDWLAWLEKIRSQFLSGAFFAPNDIAFAKTWHHGGPGFAGADLVGEAVVWLARLLLTVFLVRLLRRGGGGTALALGGLASLAMMPWISGEYLQYYSFPISLTLVFFLRERRSFFLAAVPLVLLNQALVDFPHPAYVEHIGALVWPKTLVYYAAPLLLLALLAARRSPQQATGAGGSATLSPGPEPERTRA